MNQPGTCRTFTALSDTGLSVAYAFMNSIQAFFELDSEGKVSHVRLLRPGAPDIVVMKEQRLLWKEEVGPGVRE